MDFSQISEAARALSKDDRAKLADILLFSLDQKAVAEIEEVWGAKLDDLGSGSRASKK
jgi:hypothetical protein